MEIDMRDTVTRPMTSTEWAAALNVATATRATLHHEGDLHSAASDLISFAHAGGTAAGVSLAGGEIHALHGLDDAELLSADGEWLVSWSSQDGYWTGWLYERPEVRVAIDVAHDMRVAGLPDHPAIVRQQLTTWRTAAYRIADELLANLHIVYPGYHGEGRADPPHTDDGDLTLAGRIWQGAHDASGPGVDASWLVADLEHDEDFNSWELTVRRYHARGRPEHTETVVTGTPEPSSADLDASLRERGYGTIGPWVEVGGYGHGDTGILVVRP